MPEVGDRSRMENARSKNYRPTEGRRNMRVKFKVTIEHDIPVPEVSSRKWPFATMKPGDSFLVPNEYRSAAQSAMSWFGKRNNMKFCSRKIDDRSFRIWRIE
jgi:hypothetical protein